MDVTKLSDIFEGMNVKIISTINSTEQNIGIIYKIISLTDNPEGIEVMLKNGDQGNVVSVINSNDIIIRRILATESDDSENKLNFYDLVMKEKVIPITVSSFLNGGGGYLYIGIADDGKKLEERLVGLNQDREIVKASLIKNKKLQPGEELTDQKFMDKFRSDIEDQLEKFLSCSTRLGSLTEYDFPIINGVMILEILIKNSPVPVFYNFPARNKHIKFQISQNGDMGTSRELDEFHYRNGSHKGHCDTFAEFLEFYRQHFKEV